LSPLDLMTYKMVNKEAHTVVKDLQRSAFRAERVLSPFFSADEMVRFRQVRFAYKFLISGSTALSFFTREVIEHADLNIYIWPKCIMVLILLLQSMGYTFVPIENSRKEQPSEAQVAVEAMMYDLRSGSLPHEIWDGSSDEPYPRAFLLEVFNFKRNRKKIQLIAAYSPLAAFSVVLPHFSAADMNIISCSHAISFYPRLTFYERIALANFLGRSDRPSQKTASRYENRGYTFIFQLDALTAIAGRYSALDDPISRRPGDVYCWTVPLEPIPDTTCLDFKSELLFEETWGAQFESYWNPTPRSSLVYPSGGRTSHGSRHMV
ncbi:hypothetical protein L218DRAFT_1019279, partial [Marasmius fiardii PR-910]